ncbi:radial spoke head 14 homolog isoform X1 [Paramacrobiotus metropolitanus]|uniref:radial spoke head 14 homolog isoform X1 n=1 Tax=Paramacrobiotus metropolitanus TaxID=2943436 RepID=UPI0024465391|nr:radial spoke head 14 homolog isoform X1 [Paramacrobiotus metropolitanus]
MSSEKIMSLPSVSDTYPPRVDFTMTPLAFGLRAVPLLMKEMQFGEVIVRRRALNSLAMYLCDPRHVQECLDQGVIRILNGRLREQDYLVRERTTACLQLLSQYERGCDTIILEDVVDVLRYRIDDEETDVRVNVYSVFRKLSTNIKGAFEIANYNLVVEFVAKVHNEVPEVQKVLLEILHNIMDHSLIRQDILKTPAVQYFTEFLQNPDVEIQERAARCLGDVAQETEGKIQANRTGTVEQLVAMLLEEPTGCLAAVTYALMMILVDIEARYRALKHSSDLLLRLIKVARNPTLEVAINALKCATLLAETPERRALYTAELATVEDLNTVPEPLLKQAIKTFVEVVTWKP